MKFPQKDLELEFGDPDADPNIEEYVHPALQRAARWGFEQAKQLMLAKIKEHKGKFLERKKRNKGNPFAQALDMEALDCLTKLEDDLK